jgi:hypothetical protein
MKKLSFLFVFIFYIGQVNAQIRIEKRHYRKGFYVSFTKSERTKPDDAIIIENNETEKKELAYNTEPISIDETGTEYVRNAANENEITESATTVHKSSTVRSETQKATTAIKQVSKKTNRTIRKFTDHAKNLNRGVTDPGESMWAYIFGPILIAIGIAICVMGAIAAIIFIIDVFITYGWAGILLLLICAGLCILFPDLFSLF